MHVEIDLFSGRSNPIFELSNSEADTFRTALGILQPCPDIAPPTALGYRGFVVTDDSTGQKIVVANGRAWTAAGCLEDGHRCVERILLRLAQCKIEPQVFSILARQAAVPPE